MGRVGVREVDWDCWGEGNGFGFDEVGEFEKDWLVLEVWEVGGGRGGPAGVGYDAPYWGLVILLIAGSVPLCSVTVQCLLLRQVPGVCIISNQSTLLQALNDHAPGRFFHISQYPCSWYTR